MNERPALAGGALKVTTGQEVSSSLPPATSNRAALRRLLHQIDTDEPLRRRAVQQAILTASA